MESEENWNKEKIIGEIISLKLREAKIDEQLILQMQNIGLEFSKLQASLLKGDLEELLEEATLTAIGFLSEIEHQDKAALAFMLLSLQSPKNYFSNFSV